MYRLIKRDVFIGFLLIELFTLILFFRINTINAYEDNNHHQPYKLIKSEIRDEQEINKLLIITSIEPKDSEFYEIYNNKINDLSQIIQSHWEIDIEIINFDKYKGGQLSDFDAIFLIEEYGRTIPYILFNDLATSKDKEIIWSGFGTGEFIARLINRNLYPQYSHSISAIKYKGEIFSSHKLSILTKYKYPDSSDNVDVLASYIESNEESKPFILDINTRFLILPFEIPFSYSIDNFSLVFLDVLHHSLGHHKSNSKALIRLEDIDAYTHRRPDKLVDAYEYLKYKNIPFHIALIARYINPEKDIDLEIGDRFYFKKILTQMINEGLGTAVQHGYTHQTEGGISSYDYEFWDAENDQPLYNDSEEFVSKRILSAQEIMKKNNIPVPDIWETPHYTASYLDEKVINSFYPLRYGDLKDKGKFPFSVSFDNTTYFPENLGFVDSQDDLEIIENKLKKLSVFEDPVVSFFWHPWRDLEELKFLVEIIQQENYEFVSVYDLVEINNSETHFALTNFRENSSLLLQYRITEVWMLSSFFIFSLGGVIYVRNMHRVKKYFKKIKRNKISTFKLRKYAKRFGKKLPTIAFFIPAKMEGYVIENTIKRLSKIKYPKINYRIFVIADERDINEKPEILTKDVVVRLAKELNKKFQFNYIHSLEVPRWYSGKIGNFNKVYKKSSKGRALNWALQEVYKSNEWKKIDMIGVLDADGRVDINVLKEVAYKRLKHKSKLLQGPVFQVSNFSQVSMVGVAAGLELALHHMTKLAHRLIKEKDRPQFLAGTNYFVDKELIKEVGGWDDDALVEDAELALRSYVKKGVVAEWLSWPEVEQTPANYGVYRKQRDRWVRGHLDLIPYIIHSKINISDKIRFLSEIFSNMFRIIIDLGFPVIGWILMISGILLDLGIILRLVSLMLLIMSFFVWDYYGSMYRALYDLDYIKNPGNSKRNASIRLFSFHPLVIFFNGFYGDFEHKFLTSIKLILYIPIFIIAQSIPRITGSYKYLFNKEPGTWYKTERTKENIIE